MAVDRTVVERDDLIGVIFPNDDVRGKMRLWVFHNVARIVAMVWFLALRVVCQPRRWVDEEVQAIGTGIVSVAYVPEGMVWNYGVDSWVWRRRCIRCRRSAL